jgi:copper transport protein
VHLYTYGANGLPVDVQGIDAEATPSADQSGPVDVRLLPAGTGHFIAGRVLLPTAGTWTLTLVVRTSEFDAYTTTTKLQIR